MHDMWKYMPALVHELHGLPTPVALGVLVINGLAIAGSVIVAIYALK